ncbi:MAG TPA: asparagine synthase-related protein, partial [Ferruginibacter sp.]|nr:asparagine synthase-related protein [Ferruginibacter sp.]
INAAAAFMQYGYIPTPHCIFQHTHKLKPGHYLELDLSNQSVQTTRYWNVYDAYNKPILDISLPEAITETERILSKAFQYRMVSDVPVGVFLSGG